MILLTVILTLISVLRTPHFQQLTGRIAADFLSKEFNTPVYIDKLRISDFFSARLGGIKVLDVRGMPMLEVSAIQVKLDNISLRKHEIGFKYVRLVDGGVFLRKYEGDSLLNLAYFIQHFQSEEADTSHAPAWKVSCRSLILDELSFGMRNENIKPADQGLDFNDLLISDILINLKDIEIYGDSISANIRHLSFTEKSGLVLRHFSGKSQVSPSGIRVENLNLETGRTNLDMDLAFLYRDYTSLGYFLDSVFISASIRGSLITLGDIGYFAPDLLPMIDPIMLEVSVEGFVSDFSASGLRFKTGDFTEFSGDVLMKGLPDIGNTFVSLDIHKLTTTPNDFLKFHLPLEDQLSELPGPVNLLGLTSLSGKLSGYVDEFSGNLDIRTDLGHLTIAGKLSGKEHAGEVTYFGEVTGSGIHLGKMMGENTLGTADVDLEFQGKGFDFKAMNVILSGWVENLVYQDYRYDKIVLGGEIKSKSYNGRLLVIDPCLSFSFDGFVDFNADMPKLDFSLDLLRAKLYDINLSGKSNDMNLQGRITADFTGIDPDNFTGTIRIDSMKYTEHGKNYYLHHLELKRIRLPGLPDEITLRSDYIDADLKGTFKVQDLYAHVMGFLIKSGEDDRLEQEMTDNPQQLTLDIRLKDIHPITEIFLPFLEISPGANVKGEFDSYQKILALEGNIDTISVSGVRLNDVKFTGHTLDRQFYFDGSSSRIILLQQSDTASLFLDNFSVQANAFSDSIKYVLNWDNDDSLLTNKANINGYVNFPSSSRVEAGITGAQANFNQELWEIKDTNLFIADSGLIAIRNLHISKDEEDFYLDGKISRDPTDTLSLVFSNWSLANFNPLVTSRALGFDGVINGRFGFYRNGSIPNIFAAITIQDFVFNDVFFGDADINTKWLETDNSLAVDLSLYSKGEILDRYKILGITGAYRPFNDDSNFDLIISTQNLNISVLKPLVASFSSHIAGFVSGTLNLQGTAKKPLLTGTMNLQRAELKVDFLNVDYSFANEVVFDENFIHFKDLMVYDPNINHALINGGIRHNYFSDFSLDLTIEPKQFLGFDLTRYQNDIFYGRAFATGTVKLTGPFENITIEVDARTDKGTRVTIPIRYSVDLSQSDFIVFTNAIDSLDEVPKPMPMVTGVNLDISLDVTRNADVEIILPGNIGFIRTNGEGRLRLGVDPKGYLAMNGTFRINSGLFVLSLEQLVSRRFEILEGSSISWTGDISDAEVNIVARYRVRTSLSGLGISMLDPDAASQKVIVNTDIRMTGSLLNPDLSFGITFPNLQEQTKQAVYAVLDTNDMGMMNQQAISLLVLSSFSTTGTSGSNPVTAAAIVSNTLSNMLSQISNDFNIGVNYTPGDRVTDEQLEVALSTQLMDDRLIIDGNIGVSSTSTSSQKTSSIVGDVNIEYKLTPDGRFRVKAFNRSNDLSIYTDYSPYTQGVSIFYRKEFNRVGEFFHSGKKRSEKSD